MDEEKDSINKAMRKNGDLEEDQEANLEKLINIRKGNFRIDNIKPPIKTEALEIVTAHYLVDILSIIFIRAYPKIDDENAEEGWFCPAKAISMMGDIKEGIKAFSHHLETHKRIIAGQVKIDLYNIWNIDEEVIQEGQEPTTRRQQLAEALTAKAIIPNDYSGFPGHYRAVIDDTEEEDIQTKKEDAKTMLRALYNTDDSYNMEWGRPTAYWSQRKSTTDPTTVKDIVAFQKATSASLERRRAEEDETSDHDEPQQLSRRPRGRPRTYIEAVRDDNSSNSKDQKSDYKSTMVWNDEATQKYDDNQTLQQLQNPKFAAAIQTVGGFNQIETVQANLNAALNRVKALETSLEEVVGQNRKTAATITEMKSEITEIKEHGQELKRMDKKMDQQSTKADQQYANIMAILQSIAPAGTLHQVNEQSRGDAP